MCSVDAACEPCLEQSCSYCKINDEFKCVANDAACTAFANEDIVALIVSACTTNRLAEEPGESIPSVIFYIGGGAVALCLFFCFLNYRLWRSDGKRIYSASEGVNFRRRKKLTIAYLMDVGSKVEPDEQLYLGKSNCLRAKHFTCLVAILGATNCTVELEPDFCDEAEDTLLALAHLLREHPNRVSFTTRKLWFRSPSGKAVEQIAHALPSVQSVDEVAFEIPKYFGKATWWQPVPLWLIRNQTSKVEVATEIGDLGALVVSHFVRGNKRLKSVSLRTCGLTEPKLAILLEKECLKELILSSNRLGDTAMTMLGPQFKNLRVLHLDRNLIGPKGIQALSLGTIEELSLGCHLGGNPLGDWGAISLAKLLPASLLHLRLEKCDIGPLGVKMLAEVLPKCKLLSLSLDANPITDAGAQHLVKVLSKCSLEELSLTLCSLRDDGALALTVECPATMRIKLGNNRISDLCWKTLVENPRIT